MTAVSVNHAGLSVTDLDRAVTWYREMFGLELIRGPLVLDVAAPDGGPPADIFGPGWRRARVAHMASGNGVGIELFEFTDPAAERRAENFEYWKTGIFHVCFTTADVSETAKRITESSGHQRSNVHEIAPGCVCCYCEDPFGNIIELVNRSYERVNANRGD